MSTALWAEAFIKLPQEIGALQSDFSLYYGPHLHGIFAAMDDPAIHDIYCMKGAQVLWTTALIAYLFKRIETDPALFIGMFSTEAAATKFSLDKLRPMGLACEPIAKNVNFGRSRSTGNTTLRKEFTNGSLRLVGSNSPDNVKGLTSPLVFVEEPDDASSNVGKQGDSITMLFERTKLKPNAKRILGGTPGLKGFSHVANHIELSDKRVLPVYCFECGDSHVLDFENVTGWQADGTHSADKHPIYGFNKPANAAYACPHCGCAWDDYIRREYIRKTVEEALTANDPLCGWVRTADVPNVAGFYRLGEIYSCIPAVSQEKLVQSYLTGEYYASRGDNTKQIVFINSKLGKPYEFQDGREDSETLRENAKADPESQRAEKRVAREGLIITVGIDVQDNRLAILIRAHGRRRRSWLLYADEIYAKGSTTNELDPVWGELDRIVFAAFEHESGRSLYAAALSIDSGGHATDAVYSWVLTRQKRFPAVRVMAIKGSSSSTNPPVFVHPAQSKVLSHIRPDKLTKKDRRGVKLYMVGTNKAKDFIAAQLAANARGETRFHFYSANQMRPDLFEHYVAEAKIPNKAGRQVWTQKSGCPCEFWDCEVYAEHAARALSLHTMDDAKWDAIEEKINQSDLFEESVPLAPVLNDAPRARRASTFKRRT